jgi:hypothetical protein
MIAFLALFFGIPALLFVCRYIAVSRPRDEHGDDLAEADCLPFVPNHERGN